MRATAPPGVVWSVLCAELGDDGRGQRVLDVGGGSGVLAVPLAERGCSVTVIDASADALATLRRRAGDAGVDTRVRAVQGDLDTLLDVVPADDHDLVLCHSVLEVVDDPAAAVVTLARTLRPGGALSLVVANRAATVLARALAGQPAQAQRALTDPDGRWGEGDAVRRRFDVERIAELLEVAELTVEQVHGIRVFADLVPGSVAEGHPGAGEELHRLELAACALPPYRDIAAHVHVLARRGGRRKR